MAVATVDPTLFCCPSIISQALRAAIVAAELPLRGKPRAEATTSFIDLRILEVVYQRLHTLLVQGLILSCQARIAPCSTHGQNWRGKPRVFCWVRVFDLESGGARCARGPYTHALRARSALCAVRLPLVELGLIVRISIFINTKHEEKNSKRGEIANRRFVALAQRAGCVPAVPAQIQRWHF